MLFIIFTQTPKPFFEKTFKIHPRYHAEFKLNVPRDKYMLLKVENAPVDAFSVVLFDEKGYKYFSRDKDSSWSMHTLEGDSVFVCYTNKSETLYFAIWNNSYEENWINPTVKVFLLDKYEGDAPDCFVEYGEEEGN